MAVDDASCPRGTSHQVRRSTRRATPQRRDAAAMDGIGSQSSRRVRRVSEARSLGAKSDAPRPWDRQAATAESASRTAISGCKPLSARMVTEPARLNVHLIARLAAFQRAHNPLL